MTRCMLAVLALALFTSPALAEDAKAPENPVTAIVNGEDIRLTDVNDMRVRLPQQYRSAPLSAVYTILLESLISTKLAAKAARSAGLRDDEEVTALLARIEEQVLEQAYMQREIETRTTEAALQARYEKLVAETAKIEEVKASHILVETETEAREITASLKAGGEFAKLAEQHSTDTGSAKQGGDLGFFRHDRMVPAFADAAFALEKGAVTEKPVKTEFGWHIIKLTDRRNAQPPSFEESKGGLRNELAQEIGSAIIKELREGAEIQRFAMDGSPLTEGGKPEEKTEAKPEEKTEKKTQ